MSRESLLAVALAYADRGWSVVPIKPREKRPLTRHGYKDATRDPQVIKHWWSGWPDASIGIATGSISDLVVLDIDPRNGGSDSLAELEAAHGALPCTPRVETGGGGEHIYLAHPGGDIRGSSSALGPGIDIKARGGYVLAPPSVHGSGVEYRWSITPDECSLALPTGSLGTLLSEGALRGRTRGTDALLPAEVPERERNDRLYRWACRLRGDGMDEAEIHAAVIAANQSRCHPPLDPVELEEIARNASRFEKGARPSMEGEPVAYDEKTGHPIGPLDQLNREVRKLGGTVEFVRVRQIGAQRSRWILTVRSKRTGEPFELESLTTKQIRTLSNLAERVDEANGGSMPTPRQGSEKWRPLWEAIKLAADFEDHGATEVGSWRRRLALYVRDNVRRLDPEGAEEKHMALIEQWPIVAPDGCLWIHAGSWLEFLERGRIDADEATVRSALRQMGFEKSQLTGRVDGEPRTRRYWRSPPGFDWEEENP